MAFELATGDYLFEPHSGQLLKSKLILQKLWSLSLPLHEKKFSEGVQTSVLFFVTINCSFILDISVSDPYHFDLDPDPHPNPDPDPR